MIKKPTTIEIKEAKVHNLKNINISIPLNKFVAISGVSGSGKTTLILESLILALQAKIAKTPLPKHVKSIVADNIKRVNLIDATPIGINVRSTIGTYSGILDDLREIYSKTEEARAKKYTSSDFSYNTGKFKCKSCDGTGQISMDVQFLPDVEIVCPDCNGSRYSKEVENIKIFLKNSKIFKNGINLPQFLSLTIDQILEEIKETEGLKKIQEKLQILVNLLRKIILLTFKKIIIIIGKEGL